MHSIAILDDYCSNALELADWSKIQRQADITVFNEHLSMHGDAVHQLSEFEIIVGIRDRALFSAELIDRLPRLALIAIAGQRQDVVAMSAANMRGIKVETTPVAPFRNSSVSELVFAMALDHARGISAGASGLRNGTWQTGLGTTLSGKTLGVLGLGRTGTEVCRIAIALGMNVLAWSENLTPERAEASGAEAIDLTVLLAQCDYVSIHLQLSDRTRGLIDQSALGKMKPSAFLINTSRAEIVDETHLVAALRSGQLGGAGLDVFADEPLPKAHPFLQLPNVILTPHIGFMTKEVLRFDFQHIVARIERFLSLI